MESSSWHFNFRCLSSSLLLRETLMSLQPKLGVWLVYSLRLHHLEQRKRGKVMQQHQLIKETCLALCMNVLWTKNNQEQVINILTLWSTICFPISLHGYRMWIYWEREELGGAWSLDCACAFAQNLILPRRSLLRRGGRACIKKANIYKFHPGG